MFGFGVSFLIVHVLTIVCADLKDGLSRKKSSSTIGRANQCKYIDSLVFNKVYSQNNEIKTFFDSSMEKA